MIIVHGMINYLLNPNEYLNINELFKILQYIAIYFFALNFYKRDFNNQTIRFVIILLSLPLILVSISSGIALTNHLFASLELFLIVSGFYIQTLIPIAMIVYTIMSFRQIDY